MQLLFAYGTLQKPSLIQYVLGRVPIGEPARLDGFRRYTVRDADYPGIVPGSGEVDGVLYHGLSERDLASLDRYEDDLYQRTRVEVRLVNGARSPCWTYVVPPAQTSSLSYAPWHLTQFQRNR